MTLVELLILTFGVFRLTRLVIEDTITEPLRDRILGRWPGRDVVFDPGDKVRGGTLAVGGKLYAVTPTKLGDKVAKLLTCPWCIGFWISLLVVLTFWLWPVVTVWVLLPFALSAGVGFLSSLDK